DTAILEALDDPPELGATPGKSAKRYALDRCCERRSVPGKVDDLKGLARRHGGFDAIPLDDPDYLAYLRGDVEATAALGRVLYHTVSEYAWREMRVVSIAATMSTAGFAVDRDLLDRRQREIQNIKVARSEWLGDRCELPITKADGKPVRSPHATKAGRAELISTLLAMGVADRDLPRTPKGAVSFNGKSMRELAEFYGDEEIAEFCLAVADLTGARTVYDTAAKYLCPDGRVHPDVLMYQASGRWSVIKPGLTVFGKRGGRVVEREIFVPSEGHVLISADLSQIDARAVAVHSQDHAYLDLFRPGVDSHTEVAKLVWGDGSRRHDAKAIGHGWNYGMGLQRLAATAGVSPDTAERFDSTMRERFPDLVQWQRDVRDLARAGELLDNGFGRRMRPNPDRAHTQGPALMGQGTARDLMMECLLRAPDDVVRMLRALVHDEIVLEVPTEDERDVRAILHQAMNFEWAPPGASRPVPIIAECGPSGRNWAECY
ncbi:MAG: hypothetical protein LC749_04480, partial [Actinobacteria bacterium]|nr:hypothetical protein [Actinomycetota bacterium]